MDWIASWHWTPGLYVSQTAEVCMKFYRNLYVGESIEKPKKVKWKLRHQAGQFQVYVIALAEGDDQLEIYHCAFLQQKYYKKHPPYIIGIAGGYEEAVELVMEIAQAAVKETGSADLKRYLFPEMSKR